MSLLKRTLAIAFAASVSLIPVQTGAQEPEFRYFTWLEDVLNKIENGEDVRGYKLCATEEWSPLYSAKPDVVKGFGVVFSQSAAEAVLGVGTLCELAALEWTEGEQRNESKKALKGATMADEFQPITSLNKE